VTTTGGLLQAGTFAHDALFYRSQDEYAGEVCSFVRDGLAAAEPVLVAAPGRRLDLVRAALGEAAEAVSFADMTALGRNPGRTSRPYAASPTAAGRAVPGSWASRCGPGARPPRPPRRPGARR
jgi:hypothetical protein